MIRLRCPICALKLGVDEARTGRLVRCPKCREKFRVPGEKKLRPEELKLLLQHKQRREADEADKTWVGDKPPLQPASPSPRPAPPPNDLDANGWEIEEFEIVASDPDLDSVEDQSRAKFVKLATVPGLTPIREIRLRRRETLIGRGPGCNLKVKSSSVSRKHCRLTFV